jgi:hypothetical protein
MMRTQDTSTQTKRPGYRDKEPAQGLVEFALVLPILLLLVFGVIEFGRLLFFYTTVFTASREATRFGAGSGKIAGLPRYNDCDGIRERALLLGKFAGVSAGDVSIKYDSGPGTAILDPSNCPIPSQYTVIGGIHRIRVTVNAEFEPIVPLVSIPAVQIASENARTILGNMTVKSNIPVIPAPLPGEMHVGDLHATRYLSGGGWVAEVRVTMHDKWENLIQGVTIKGIWTDVENTEVTFDTLAECTTNYDGYCTVTSEVIPIDVTEISFTVSNVTDPPGHPYHDFNPADNHDEDHDGGEGYYLEESDEGNTIRIPSP